MTTALKLYSTFEAAFIPASREFYDQESLDKLQTVEVLARLLSVVSIGSLIASATLVDCNVSAACCTAYCARDASWQSLLARTNDTTFDASGRCRVAQATHAGDIS
jgi:hypothetical protein